MTKNVSFVGLVSQQDIVQRYLTADILVNPSLSEAFGMSLVEGMAAGKPVIGTRVGGMIEVIGDESVGFLVEPGAPEALAKAIIHLLSDARLRETMGMAGRKRATELFSWREVSKAFYERCNALISSRSDRDETRVTEIV
jgi:glycosyltransferase involved in cell wall biosynthesis